MGSREESVVYVQRPNEIRNSLSNSKNPMKRRRYRDDSSVAWYNLDKTKPVKEHRCTQFDDYYVRKANSSPDLPPMEDLKHGQQENKILSDFEFELQEEDKQLQTSEDNSSLNSSSAAEQTSSKSTESNSSSSDLEDSDSDEVSQASVGFKRKKLKLKGELRTHTDQKIFNMDLKDNNRDKMDNKTVEYSAFKETIADQQDAMETSLFDVHLTVKASHRAENVPFVCLTSKLNGKTILGYPLEIEKLSDVCENPRNFFDDERSRFCRLVWKTSRRTPVCYVTNSLSAPVSENVEDSIAPAGENGLLVKDKSLTELLKNTEKIERGKAAERSTCVPVELVFSKILAAVGQLQS